MQKRLFLIYLLLLLAFGAVSQHTAMGTWRIHTSYANVADIAIAKEVVYGVSSGNLFSVDKESFEMMQYGFLTGLNDADVLSIDYARDFGALFIAYSNSNIDLLFDDGRVVNIRDIAQKNMSGSKRINGVDFFGDIAYLACDFGVVEIDMGKSEIVGTYIIGDEGAMVPVLDVRVGSGVIYACTANDVKYAPRTGVNLLNYNNWKSCSDPDTSKENIGMTSIQDNIYLLKEDNTLYVFEKESWSVLAGDVRRVFSSGGLLFIENIYNSISAYGKVTYTPIAPYLFDADFDMADNTLWYVTEEKLVAIYTDDDTQEEMALNGPASSDVWRMRYGDGRIFSVPGGRFAVQYNRTGLISYYEDGRWHNIPNNELRFASPTNLCQDLVDIIALPDDASHFWVASYGYGLYEFRNDTLYKFYNYANSNIETLFPDDPSQRDYFMRIDAFALDEENNLWFANEGDCTIRYLDAEGEIHCLSYPAVSEASAVQEIIVNAFNPHQKLVLCQRYQRSSDKSMLFAFDDGGTLTDMGDDKYRAVTLLYDQDNKAVHFNTNRLRSIAQDNDGVVWVGTTSGIILLENIGEIFNADYRCRRIKISRNDGTNLADYLLGTEQINAIAVDAANRKWIATASSGVFLVSDDGQNTIHNFTTANSPLISDNVVSLAIDGSTGEVFFGTDLGIVSYQSDAVPDNDKTFSNVRAYPNPVRPGFTGLITIGGLTHGSVVRITDVNGNVIFDTTSNGAVATWNGCNKAGKRVAPGVYFAHCISADGKKKEVAKILFIDNN